jgi:hypothetical protein
MLIWMFWKSLTQQITQTLPKDGAFLRHSNASFVLPLQSSAAGTSVLVSAQCAPGHLDGSWRQIASQRPITMATMLGENVHKKIR